MRDIISIEREDEQKRKLNNRQSIIKFITTNIKESNIMKSSHRQSIICRTRTESRKTVIVVITIYFICKIYQFLCRIIMMTIREKPKHTGHSCFIE